MAMDRPWPWPGPAQKARRLLYKNTAPFTIQESHAIYYTRIRRRLLYKDATHKNTMPFNSQANHANTIQANRANILGASRRLLT